MQRRCLSTTSPRSSSSGAEAWAGTLDSDPAGTTVYWFADGTYRSVTAAGLTVDELEQIVAGLDSVSVDEWTSEM